MQRHRRLPWMCWGLLALSASCGGANCCASVAGGRQSSRGLPLGCSNRAGCPRAAAVHGVLRLRGGADPFPALVARDGEAIEVGSLCMNCEEQGTTRILPTTIPRFGQVVIMAFECPACNYTSNDVQNAAEVKPFGVEYILSAATRDDLDRQVIKSNHATIVLPDLDFAIPPATQSGSLSTVEGVLTHAAKSLEYLQPQRRAADPTTAGKVQDVIDKLRKLATGTQPFVLTLDDPSGQSIIESKSLGSRDFELSTRHYARSSAQNAALGIFSQPAPDASIPPPASQLQSDGIEGAEMANCEASGGAETGRGHFSSLGGGGRRWVADKAVDFAPTCAPGERGGAQALDDLLVPSSPDEVEVRVRAFLSACSDQTSMNTYAPARSHAGAGSGRAGGRSGGRAVGSQRCRGERTAKPRGKRRVPLDMRGAPTLAGCCAARCALWRVLTIERRRVGRCSGCRVRRARLPTSKSACFPPPSPILAR
jgi:ZPR1 zinc finger protein